MSLFKGKTLMITGGTGSFGNAVLNRFLKTDIGEIRIFSRDEKKQDDMRHDFQVRMPEVADKIKFYIGDVRDLQSVRAAMPGVDYIFHAAALKQVPSCEFFPMEAVRTNVIGTENVLTAAIEEGVESVICLSTDKAAYPINAMGITKAIEEKVAVAKSRMSGKTKICCTRYGNVMCSRGSVIPLWIDQIKQGNPITLTEPSMTRFIMSLEEAVDLVLFAFEHGENGDLLIQKAPACTIQTQAEAVCELFGGKKEDIKVIGIRHGDVIVKALDEKEDMEATDEEQFNLLAKLLGGLYAEFSSLAKKQPDALTNAFKTSQVNRVLSPLKQIMASEDSTQYLDLLQEADDGQANGNGKGRSSYSDAVIIMSQYKTACDEFRLKYFNKGWDMLWQR